MWRSCTWAHLWDRPRVPMPRGESGNPRVLGSPRSECFRLVSHVLVAARKGAPVTESGIATRIAPRIACSVASCFVVWIVATSRYALAALA